MKRLLLLLPMLLATAAAPGRNPGDVERYRECLALAETAPAQAMTFADRWRADGGGVPARHCVALAQLAAQDYAAATATLEAAARAAEAIADPLTGELWGQAGNAALLAGKPAQALGYLNSALAAAAGGPAPRRAELLIDHARAAVELGDVRAARQDLVKATALDPTAADGWLLIATLARADNELKLAEGAILNAAQHAPGDVDVALEAGNIALAQGKLELARKAWAQVVAATPDSPAGRAAAKALAAHPG